MNIEKFLNANLTPAANKNNYASSSKRGLASTIDAAIVLFLRVTSAQILGMIFVLDPLKQFLAEFKDKFGTEFVKNNPDHISFVLHHRIFLIVMLFCAAIILVGALYHAILNSSAWQGTIGKRLVGIAMEKEDGSPISFNIGLIHYFLSILPFTYILYIISYQVAHNTTFFHSITGSAANVFFGILFLLWTHIQMLTSRKTTAYDLICKTVFLNKKIAAKFPWNKVKVSNFL